MAHSLRSRLQGLVYKGLLEKKDLERIVIIPKDATNGDVLRIIFSEIPFSQYLPHNHFEADLTEIGNNRPSITIHDAFWDAPYKKGGTE